MSLGNWSAFRTVGTAFGWILFVLLVAGLQFFTGRTTDSEGGMVVVEGVVLRSEELRVA